MVAQINGFRSVTNASPSSTCLLCSGGDVTVTSTRLKMSLIEFRFQIGTQHSERGVLKKKEDNRKREQAYEIPTTGEACVGLI